MTNNGSTVIDSSFVHPEPKAQTVARIYRITSGQIFTLYLLIENLTVQIITSEDEKELIGIGTGWVESGYVPHPYSIMRPTRCPST